MTEEEMKGPTSSWGLRIRKHLQEHDDDDEDDDDDDYDDDRVT
jgi:hypothetical protein